MPKYQFNSDDAPRLPDGFVVWENSDGSMTVTKTGWRRWKNAFSCLLLVSFLVGGWAFIFFEIASDPATRTVVGAIGIVAAAVIVPCTLSALFGHEEWHVAPDLLDHRFSLWGLHWGRTYRDAVIQVDMYVPRSSSSSSSGGSRRVSYTVSVSDPERSRTLCQEPRAADAKAIGAFLTQQTGWPFDKRLGD
jgi:hypothetical protein